MKLSGTLPKADDEYFRNGLAQHAADVVRHPDERRIAIVVLSTAKLIDNRAEHSVEPIMAIDRIELVRPMDAGVAEKLLIAALQDRTRGLTLPVFVLNDVTEAFTDGATNHSTGEINAIRPLAEALGLVDTLELVDAEPADDDEPDSDPEDGDAA